MEYIFNAPKTKSFFSITNENVLYKYRTSRQLNLYTFIWAKSSPVDIIIDGVPTKINKNEILSLTPIQFLEYNGGEDLVIYQFNREFYCIKDHDKEVSCVGLLFYGNTISPIIKLSDDEVLKFETLHNVFLDEMKNDDNIQEEMLRMLMSRFIIKTTRLLKQSTPTFTTTSNSKIDLLRTFNFLVEQHFKTEHTVAFYADELNKSPKTLSNSFAMLNRSPLQIIHKRIILEMKRLLTYTDKTSKEIAFELGFSDPSHLSRLFKKYEQISPTSFKKQLLV